MDKAKRAFRRRLGRAVLPAAAVFLAAHLLFAAYILIRLLPLRENYPIVTSIMSHRGEEYPQVYVPHLRLPLEEIPADLVRTILYVEDYGFFEHPGFSIDSIRYAIRLNRRLGYKAYGGSTITQQLARTLFLTPRKSYFRKYLELIIAVEAEWVLGKTRILELYLNLAEWGPGVYGVAEAALFHFGLPPSGLSIAEKADLVAIMPSPLHYTPQTYQENHILVLRRQAVQRFADRALTPRPVFKSDIRELHSP